MPITWLDIIVLVFMLISALLAMARGFTREVLSIVSWALAAGATVMLFPRFREQARGAIQPDVLADVVLVFGVFLVTLIVVSFITIRLADKILDSRVGALDRTLGFVFGLARGLVIVVIAYLFFTWLVPERDRPVWVNAAKSRALLDYTGSGIISLLPDDPEATLSKIKPALKGVGGDDTTDGEGPQDSEGKGGDSDANSSYKRSERQGLDQLLESTRGSNTQ